MCSLLKPVPPLSLTPALTSPGPAITPIMSPSQIQAWRHEHGLTQRQLAHLVGAGLSTVKGWEGGYHPAPPLLPIALGWYETMKRYQDGTRTRVKRLRQRRADREIAEKGLPDPKQFL